MALFMVLVVTAFLSALALGTVLAVFMDRLASGNTKGSVAMFYAADAGIELAARDLAQISDWSPVLAGTQQGTFTDGISGGVRTIGGRNLDLSVLTNSLNCGRSSSCTASQMNANSTERPWGLNNPQWHLFAYGPLDALPQFLRPAPCYLVVWVADDSREQDGNPLADAGNESDPGHGIVRVHAEVFATGSARRAVEAELVRACAGPQGASCPTGIRVQSWQELRQVVP